MRCRYGDDYRYPCLYSQRVAFGVLLLCLHHRSDGKYLHGKEFSDHEKIAADLNASCYFATPYHSWERGLNEHTNGLVRQYLPKSSTFDTVTDEKIQWIENRLNNRPRKVLQYRTPFEVFYENTTTTNVLRFSVEWALYKLLMYLIKK